MDESRQPTAREEALARVGRAKRWLVGGAVALTGVFSAVAAHALPASHASSKTQAASPAPAPSVDDNAPSDQNPDLVPPAQVPQAAVGGGGVVSGGS